MAGRIPESFIRDLLARTDIVQVIGERLQLKKAGKEYQALSPFSNEKTPSFTVSPQKQFYHCFSSGKHGTAITFLMEYERLSFPEAVEELARKLGLEVPREGGGPAAPRVVLDGPLDALAAAERIYRNELRQSSVAIEYLKQRGLNGETAKRFGIGFAPDRWDTLASQLPQQFALEAGLLVKNDAGRIYDFYRNRVMFPVRDLRGRIITFGGRVMPGSDDARKYLNGRETALFDKSRNLYGLYEARQGTGTIPYILVVEGYMDVVMLAQHGIPHAVATMGTATTREHLNLLFKTTDRVVFCFDGDRAGRAAAWRALEQALSEVYDKRECRFMFLPDNAQGGKHDPDSFVRELGAEEFNRRVESAKTLSGFLIDELRKQANTSTPDGRARLAALAQPFVMRLRDGPLRAGVLDELAGLTKLQPAEILAAHGSGPATPPAAGPVRPMPDIARPVLRALQLLLEQPALAAEARELDRLAESGTAGIELLTATLDWFHENPGSTAAQLLEAWRGEAKGSAVEQVAALPLGVEPAELRQEFREAVTHLEQRGLRGRAQALLEQARERGLTPEEAQELDALSRQLAGVRPA